MECFPLHGGRVWFCHLNSPASFFISCPHTYPQGVEKSSCFDSGPNSQRRLGRNLSPGKCERSHVSGGEYMGVVNPSAKGGNTPVSRDGTNRRSPESPSTERIQRLGENGSRGGIRRFPHKSDAAMFRGQWRNFAVRSETSRSRPRKGGRAAIGVESCRPDFPGRSATSQSGIPHHEAYLSAQRATPQAEAWIPYPNADSFRARRDQASSPQGPAATHCLTTDVRSSH